MYSYEILLVVNYNMVYEADRICTSTEENEIVYSYRFLFN